MTTSYRLLSIASAFLLVLLAPPALDAQVRGEIRGRVVGSQGEPVAAAAVAARSTADTTRVVGAMTAQSGAFRLEVAPGQYRVRITHLGYEPQTREVTITAAAPAADLGTIQLTTAAVAIGGVTVEAGRSPVVVAADHTIYHTRDMPAVQGGVATDALRTVPELEVDLEGRVTLQGASPRIHINGRPTPMQGEALQQFLQQLPANRIDRIEVMPNPSARFEAEGAGGIVNIVLRSDTGLGLSGSLGVTAGTRGQTGGFANLAYQEGRLTLFGNGSLNFQRRSGESYDLRQNLTTEPSTFLLQEGTFRNDGHFGRGDLSAELRLTGRSHLWSTLSGGGFGADAAGSSVFTFMDELRDPTQSYGRTTSTDFSRTQADASLGFRHVIEPNRHEFSLETRRSYQGGGNDGRFLTQLQEVGEDPLVLPPAMMTNFSDEDEWRTWLKADYDRPVGGTRVQVGYQANFQATTTEQLRESFAAEGDAPIGRTLNAFRYDETFHQGYLTLSRTFGRLAAQAGVRAEQAHTEFTLPETEERFDNRYTSLFPNANLGYDLGQGRRLGLNYSRRIQRPMLWFLSPVDMSIDPLTRRVGNPRLQPQYTHRIGADLSWNLPQGMLRVAPYYRYTDNDWGQISRIDSAGVLTTTWENVASIQGYGTQLSAMLRSAGRLSGNVGFGLHREERDASNLAQDFSGTFWRYNGNANLTMSVDRTLALQGMLWYNSPQELPQGRRSAWVMSSIGLRKQFFNNQATLNLRVEDPFALARYDIETRDRTHVQIARNQFTMRAAALSLSYNFGRRPQSVRRPGTEEPQQPQPDPMGIPVP